MLSVCICTHNPNVALLSRVIEALAAQTAAGAFDALIVDNVSAPPLSIDVLRPLEARGVPARLVREETPGLVHARLRAIAETRSDWMLCVDDDNILAADYVAEGLAFIEKHADVGAFGGKLLLPPNIRPPHGAAPFLPFLAIRDVGEAPMIGLSAKWEIWEPPAAGAFIARAVLEDFRDFVRTHPGATALGRSPTSLASCEDSLLMHSAYRLGRRTAYNPRLRLEHHIDPQRLEFARLVRLMESYGRSHIVLDWLLRGPLRRPLRYQSGAHVALTMLVAAVRNLLPSPAFGYARARYHLAAARAYRDLAASAP